MRLAIAFGACALGLGSTIGCSRESAPPPAPAPTATAPPAAAAPAQPGAGSEEALDARVREQLEKAAQQADAQQPGQSPSAMSEQDMAQARKAIEGMLENVRKELEQKSAALAQPGATGAAPNAAPSPAPGATPNRDGAGGPPPTP